MLVDFTSTARPPKRAGVVVCSTGQQAIIRGSAGGRTDGSNADIQTRRRIFGEGTRRWSLLSSGDRSDWQAGAEASDLLNVAQRPFAGNGAGLFGRLDRAAVRMIVTPRPTAALSAGQRAALASITAASLVSSTQYEVDVTLSAAVVASNVLITASIPVGPGRLEPPSRWRNVWQIPIDAPFGPGTFQATIDSGWPITAGQRVWFICQFLNRATLEEGRVQTGPFIL